MMYGTALFHDRTIYCAMLACNGYFGSRAVTKPEHQSLDLKTEDWALFNKLPHSTYKYTLKLPYL